MRAITVPADPAVGRFATAEVGWLDAAGVPVSRTLDPLEVGRACFSGAPRLLRVFLIVGWKLLRMQGPAVSDADHVLGWPVVQTAPAAVLQRRSGWGIEATLAFAVSEGVVSFSSGMVFSGRPSRTLWMMVAPVHRWTARFVLAHAVAP